METRIKFYVNVGLSGCNRTDVFTLEDVGLDQEEWDAMTGEERQDFLIEFAKDELGNYVDYGAFVE